MSWNRSLTGFDIESTGVDVETDRIVTAAVIDTALGQETNRQEWLADPGIEIPEAAAKIHKISTNHARTHGRPAADVVTEIGALLASRVRAGVPLVIMNAPYDLTLLDREFRRYGLPSLAVQAGAEPVVIDPMVLDKAACPRRRGKRKLTDLAALYKVALSEADAHDAGADALAAVRVALAVAERYRELQVPAELLHRWQVKWAFDQAASLEAYFRSIGKGEVVNRSWPMRPYGGAA